MARKVFYADPYARELNAVVTAVDGAWITFDQTLFYPQGGGQPGDRGQLTDTHGNTRTIADARKGENGAVVHQMAEAEHGLQPGAAVHMALDWERRHRHMRMHTCLHLLGALIPAGVTGGQVGADKGRLDFDVSGLDLELDKAELNTRLNALIEEGHAVDIEHVDEAVLERQPELVRTMSVQPPRGVGRLRMVRIVDVDYQPCGGTHVANTAEIGPVKVSKIQSKGRHNRRVQVVFDE
ncbi:MAG TPA: alanyl-tRNA editing protein [Salinisphaeraceae bacterium]|nr:alanyl-tRNA editing protein [Salinisphaeraceae bacterium]